MRTAQRAFRYRQADSPSAPRGLAKPCPRPLEVLRSDLSLSCRGEWTIQDGGERRLRGGGGARGGKLQFVRIVRAAWQRGEGRGSVVLLYERGRNYCVGYG